MDPQTAGSREHGPKQLGAEKILSIEFEMRVYKTFKNFKKVYKKRCIKDYQFYDVLP